MAFIQSVEMAFNQWADCAGLTAHMGDIGAGAFKQSRVWGISLRFP